MFLFVSHLEATADGSTHSHRAVQTVHAGLPLLVRYDMSAVRGAVDKCALASRAWSPWRYAELLPLEQPERAASLGEVVTPLVPCPRLGERLGLSRLLIKDESCLPTASFKARGLFMAVNRARELGIGRVAIPTAGNAGGALAAYAARAGLEAFVFMPADTPLVNRCEAVLYGARVYLVEGLINDCGAVVRAGTEPMEWLDMSTLKEPYRLEGKKTMGLELAEQLGWMLPDAILYPTGGGTGLIGMWKAFGELAELGWLASESKPRMFACQSDGCAPLFDAFLRGERFAKAPDRPRTEAAGLRVPKPLGDFLILDAVRASGGEVRAGREERLRAWMRLAAESEGLSLCPESAICLDVLDTLVREKRIRADEQVVLFNTASAQKYVELLDVSLPRIEDVKTIDWQRMQARPEPSRTAESRQAESDRPYLA